MTGIDVSGKQRIVDIAEGNLGDPVVMARYTVAVKYAYAVGMTAEEERTLRALLDARDAARGLL